MMWMEKLGSMVRGRWLRSARERWNDGYRRGKWEGLKDREEEPRLDAVVRMLRKYCPQARILEIGCGEALLQRRLAPNDFSRLVGIDLSDVVIEQAQKFASPNVTYLTDDMRSYQPTETFDAILFTESINYVRHRDEVLRHYLPHLEPEGVFIVSVFDQIRSPQIWQEVAAVLQTVETVITENDRGKWTCKVLRP